MKSLLRSNPWARRIYSYKNLVLEKLSAILSSSEQADQHLKLKFDAIHSALDSILASVHQVEQQVESSAIGFREAGKPLLSNSQASLENQALLLKSSIDLAYAVQEAIHTADSNSGELKESTRAITHELARIHDSINQVIRLVGAAQGLPVNSVHEIAAMRQDLLELRQDSYSLNDVNKLLLQQIFEAVHAQKYKLKIDPSHFQEIEIELMAYLYSFLPSRLAIDVGANRGDVSARLLQAGYEVYAFEPFPPVLEKLKERLAASPDFHALPYALGSVNETRDLHVVVDQTEDNTWGDSSFYNTFKPYFSAEGLAFQEVIPVSVKTLSTLHELGEVPCQVGLVKIDTEGFDLEVIKGMGDFRYPVVLAEFWDPALPLGQNGSMNRLKDMVPAMRQRGYSWNIVIYRVFPAHDISYYCNSDYSFEKSWGNVFFFQDHSVFSEALKWCNATMPATYFAV